jgi:hypothetical protein
MRAYACQLEIQVVCYKLLGGRGEGEGLIVIIPMSEALRAADNNPYISNKVLPSRVIVFIFGKRKAVRFILNHSKVKQLCSISASFPT